MSLLGKILTILNAVAAIAFLAIAGMDYAARQQWAYAAFRHELAIHGLPIDEKDTGWRANGPPLAREMTPKAVQDTFQGTNQKPVRTQAEAVAAARQGAADYIAAGTNDADKRRRIGAVLLPWQTDTDSRLARLAAVKTAPIADLVNQVDQQFAKVLSDIESGADRATTRQRVADLLYNFSPSVDPNYRTWVQSIVGVEEYVAAARRQATNLLVIGRQLDALIHEENGVFVRQYQDILPRLNRLNATLKADEQRLADSAKALERTRAVHKAREAERNELRGRLTEVQTQATKEAEKLDQLQSELFALQQKIAATRAANESLETEIRSKEAGQ